jgi:hypothetical protein
MQIRIFKNCIFVWILAFAQLALCLPNVARAACADGSICPPGCPMLQHASSKPAARIETPTCSKCATLTSHAGTQLTARCKVSTYCVPVMCGMQASASRDLAHTGFVCDVDAVLAHIEFCTDTHSIALLHLSPHHSPPGFDPGSLFGRSPPAFE